MLRAESADQAQVQETKLANGVRVLVREDARAPSVVHMVWYPIGSIDETDNLSGISHLLEHMMFKGTATHGPGEFSRLVARAGGRENAFTSQDYTAYFEQVPKENLPEMMALEADRMVNLRIDPDALRQEAKVVMEERRLRTEDEPLGLLHEALWATAFKVHPYRRPVIGWMGDLENMSPSDVRNWYGTWYSPARAIVVVVGDVKAADVFQMAEKYYGALPAGGVIAQHRIYQEPPQRGIQRIVVKAPAELPRLEMVWHSPSLSPEKGEEKERLVYALALLTEILSGNDVARLQSHLVRGSRIAIDAHADTDIVNRANVTLWGIGGTPSQGHTVVALEKAFRAEIADIQKNGVSDEELKRAKTQMVAQKTYEMDSMFSQAFAIGRLESVGFGWREQDSIIDNLQKVSSQDIQEAIRSYLVDDYLTVAVLDPQPLGGKAPTKQRAPVSRH